MESCHVVAFWQMQFLFIFAQVHAEFRIPELVSISELYKFRIRFPDSIDVQRPFMVLGLENEDQARLLAQRCILIKSVYEFYAQGSTYAELHAQNESQRTLWSHFIPDTSFKFIVSAYNHKIPQKRQKEVVESFSYMALLGRIDMKNPQIVFGCFEEYPSKDGTTWARYQGDGQFIQIYFGRLIVEGSARSLITTFDVKKRSYFGNTSMEAEISLLMANQTLASPGKLMYDPFVGTGSMAYTVAHFGAQILGSDIDGRQMRGKGSTPGVYRAAAQYGVAQRIIDLCTFDITQHPWRCGSLFDAIITDPPYGVRAGAKRLGRKTELSEDRLALHLAHQASPRPDDQPYIPPTKPYELSQLVTDLVMISRYMLKPGGRLVFFLSTVTEEYEEIDINSMLCRGMEVVSNSLQDFGSWGRRLVTIKKTTADLFSPPTFDSRRELWDSDVQSSFRHIPAHQDFREKYFQGFKKDDIKR